MNADNAARARMGKLRKKAEGYGIPVHDEMSEDILKEAIREYEAVSGTGQQTQQSGITAADLMKMGETIGKEIAKGNKDVSDSKQGYQEETYIEPDPADIGEFKCYYAPSSWWILPAKRVAGKLVMAPIRRIVFKRDSSSIVQVGSQWQTKFISVYVTDNKKEQAYMETHPMFGRMFFLSHKDAMLTSDQTKFAQAFGKHIQALGSVMASELFQRGAKMDVLMSHDMSLNTLRTMLAEKLAAIDIENEKLNLQRLAAEQDRLSLISTVAST